MEAVELINCVQIPLITLYSQLKTSISLSLVGLLSLLGNLRSDSVHVLGTLLGEGLANNLAGTIVVLDSDLSDETGGLELLHAVSDVLTSSLAGVLGAGTSSPSIGVVLSEGVDSNSTSDVQLVGDGGSSDVKPVIIVWWEILGEGGLVVIGPLKV